MLKDAGIYKRRFYREWVKNRDLYLTRLAIKETDIQILADRPVDRKFLKQRILIYRNQIEDYISKDRRFLTSLKPLEIELHAPPIVKEMATAAKKACVGPMASVAGAIAKFLAGDLLKRGYKEVIIENGGDIFLKTNITRTIGIYSGRIRSWRRFCLKIKPEDTPLGICTSSGTVGHSLSFGLADSVVILSKNASLADAVATATCNRVNSKQDLSTALEFAKSIRGILGIVIVLKNNLISWGRIEFAA